MDKYSFIVYLKTEGVFKGIADVVEKRSGTSNYEADRPLQKGINKKVIGLIKDELS